MQNNAIQPNYYKFQIGGQTFDVFDLVRAVQEKRPISFEESSALKYILRIKETTREKRIEDLEKARECLRREIEFLQRSVGKEEVVILEGKLDAKNNIVFSYGNTDYALLVWRKNGFILSVANKQGGYSVQCVTENLLESSFAHEAYFLPSLQHALDFLHDYLRKCMPHITFSFSIQNLGEQVFQEQEKEAIVMSISSIANDKTTIEIQSQRAKGHSHTHFYWVFQGVEYYVEANDIGSAVNFVIVDCTDALCKNYLSGYNFEFAPKFEFTHKKTDAFYFDSFERAKNLLQDYLSHLAGATVKLL